MSKDRLYQDQLLALARLARQTTMHDQPTHQAEMRNPTCGDKVTVSLVLDQHDVKEMDVRVHGCAICEASAGLIYQFSDTHKSTLIKQIVTDIQAWLADESTDSLPHTELEPLMPVKLNYRNRIKCASLPFEAYSLALQTPVNSSNKS